MPVGRLQSAGNNGGDLLIDFLTDRIAGNRFSMSNLNRIGAAFAGHRAGRRRESRRSAADQGSPT